MTDRPTDHAAAPAPPPGLDNRRNYYRVLHVQPEAPAEVIKASYRTLMSRLKLHPDLGGDHAAAALINEAWAVLGDPERRAAYDRVLRRRQAPRPARSGFQAWRPADVAASSAGRGGAGPKGGAARPAAKAAARAAPRTAPPSPPPSASPRPAGGAAASAAQPGARAAPPPPASTPAAAEAHPPPLPEHRCALCAHAAPERPRADARCLRCHAPLAAMPLPGSPGHELLGRRGALRRAQGHVAMLRIGWPAPELPVRWRDLSLTGLSLFTPQPLAVGQRIHVLDQALEAVAEVVASRPQGRLFTVHARLVTVLLLQSTGVFVSAQA